MFKKDPGDALFDDFHDAVSNDSRDSIALSERSTLSSAEASEATDGDHGDDRLDDTSSLSFKGPRHEEAGQETATDRNDHDEPAVTELSIHHMSTKPTIKTNLENPDLGHGDAHEHTSEKREEPRRRSSSRPSRIRSGERESRRGSTSSIPLPDPLDTAERPLIYQEELVLISSEAVLKPTRHSREQCKDISTTLQFLSKTQAPLDSRDEEIVERFRTLNELLKKVLLSIEPLRNEQKMAIFVIGELDILTRSASSLKYGREGIRSLRYRLHDPGGSAPGLGKANPCLSKGESLFAIRAFEAQLPVWNRTSCQYRSSHPVIARERSLEVSHMHD